ncbi:uncharacterized protein VP01_2853g2 [Puccinia sorghi]|uniref:Uncharacterized protein n=1 Tax=Puccinia sorghi TaxID=27349 RepID=A0A0L6V206_9BASI|nr:uncharacterized protein VP01_2853g2 [Puccinia sorghi]
MHHSWNVSIEEGRLGPTAEFSHNNHDYVSTGISPFKAKYGFNLSYSSIPSPEQSLPEECLQRSKFSMKCQFDKNISRNICTTRPQSELPMAWTFPNLKIHLFLCI